MIIKEDVKKLQLVFDNKKYVKIQSKKIKE